MPHALILPGMSRDSRHDSLRSSKCDSFHSAGSAAALDEVRRRSLLREQRISETLDREINSEEDKDKPAMAPPVYRLVRWFLTLSYSLLRCARSTRGYVPMTERSAGVCASIRCAAR